jgi:hypothetical protein
MVLVLVARGVSLSERWGGSKKWKGIGGGGRSSAKGINRAYHPPDQHVNIDQDCSAASASLLADLVPSSDLECFFRILFG